MQKTAERLTGADVPPGSGQNSPTITSRPTRKFVAVLLFEAILARCGLPCRAPSQQPVSFLPGAHDRPCGQGFSSVDLAAPISPMILAERTNRAPPSRAKPPRVAVLPARNADTWHCRHVRPGLCTGRAIACSKHACAGFSDADASSPVRLVQFCGHHVASDHPHLGDPRRSRQCCQCQHAGWRGPIALRAAGQGRGHAACHAPSVSPRQTAHGRSRALHNSRSMGIRHC